MSPKEFPEVNVRVAESQEEYITLPSYWDENEGSLTFCFDLSDAEVKRIYATNEIWFKQFTFGSAMQPIMMSTNKEELIPQNEES